MALELLLKVAAKNAQRKAARTFLEAFLSCSDHNDPRIREAAGQLASISLLGSLVRYRGLTGIVRAAYESVSSQPAYVLAICRTKLMTISEAQVSKEFAQRVAYEVACWLKGKDVNGLDAAIRAGVVTWQAWEYIEAIDSQIDVIDVSDLFLL